MNNKYISLGFKGKKHSLKTKIILSKKVKKIALERGFGKWMIGKKHSKETIAKMKANQTPEHRKLISEKTKLAMKKPEVRRKLLIHLKDLASNPKELERRSKFCQERTGSKALNWQGGKTLLAYKIYNSEQNANWRTSVFKRDKYTCQICFRQRGRLNAHHKIPLGSILSLYNIKTFKEATLCKLLWDINFGVTLCVNCHQSL